MGEGGQAEEKVSSERVLRHVIGVGAVALTGLLLWLAANASDGFTALFMTVFAILPGHTAWGYLNGRKGTK